MSRARVVDCGFTHPDSRESGAFECPNCGYESHTEYNVVVRLCLPGSKPNFFQTAGDLSCGISVGAKPAPTEAHPGSVRLSSGALNANKAYEPPVGGSAGVEVHVEGPRLTPWDSSPQTKSGCRWGSFGEWCCDRGR